MSGTPISTRGEFETLVLFQETTMTKSKLTFAVAAVALVISAPAFAQSVDHTGTLQPSYYDNTGKQVVGSWAPGNRAAKPSVQSRPLYNSVQNRWQYNPAALPNQ
jgi:hypothetical protein